MIGTQLGKNYQVVEKVGDGGMGVVYLVEHMTLRKQFAAKVLSAELANNPEAKARFEIEAHAASKLEHENIVNVTDYGVADDGRPYLVMELLRGKTLYQRLAEGSVSLEETVAIIVPICRGLEAAHEQGFVHRDIKPENIFLTQRSSGRFGVKVLDFGITKLRLHTNRLTKMGQALGSPMYMAPESCRGDEVDARADIYAVGVLLYQLVCGQLPFHDDNMLKVLQMQVSQPLTPPSQLRPEISEELERVICRALEKDPDQRYQSIEELEDELLAAIPPGTDVLLHGRRSTPLPMSIQGGPPTSPSGSMTSVRTPSGPLNAVRTPSGANSAVVPSTTPSAPAGGGKSRALIIAAFALIAGGGIALYLHFSGKKSGEDAAQDRTALPAAPPDAPLAGTVQPQPVPDPQPTTPVDAAAPAPPSEIKLVVKSRPTGAEVSLDGKVLGKTPLSISVPSRAESGKLRIAAKGHKTEDREIAGDRDAELSVDLVEIGRQVRPNNTVKKNPPDKTPPDPQTTKTNPNDDDIRGAR